MTTSPSPGGITVAGLRKSFGDKTVLDGIDLDVRPGTVFGLLGPNGAGKTTTVQILSTLITADAGRITVAGTDVANDPDAVRRAIGVTGQFSAVDDLLTGQENLMLMADLHHLDRADGRSRAAELLERFELTDDAGKLPTTYSGGMRRKLDLAMTLMGRPSVIFLDEPTTGLDPRSRRAMWDAVRGLAGGGVTVFLTTQYLEEADQLAGHIALLDGGRIVAEGSPAELKRLIPGGHVEVRLSSPADLAAVVRRFPNSGTDDEALTARISGSGDYRQLRSLVADFEADGVEPAELTVHTPDLDDVFLTLTGHPAATTKEPAS
jgi:ABC-2 type transport system ATP-binding protein